MKLFKFAQDIKKKLKVKKLSLKISFDDNSKSISILLDRIKAFVSDNILINSINSVFGSKYNFYISTQKDIIANISNLIILEDHFTEIEIKELINKAQEYKLNIINFDIDHHIDCKCSDCSKTILCSFSFNNDDTSKKHDLIKIIKQLSNSKIDLNADTIYFRITQEEKMVLNDYCLQNFGRLLN